MKSRRSFLPGWMQALGLVAFLSAASAIGSEERRASGPGSGAALKMQHFTLTDGGRLEAAIVGYSLQSRVITMRLPNGQNVHVAPRELTAMSQLKWLTSPAFFDAAGHVQLPDGWLISLLGNVWVPALVVAIGGFFSFWGGVSLVSGVRTMPRAFKTYCGMLGVGILIVLSAVLVQYALAGALKNVAVLPMIRSAVLIGGLVLAILSACSRMGNDYVLSGGLQFGAVMATGGIAFTLATILLYLAPRILDRSGLDHWLTDRFLTPLGLA